MMRTASLTWRLLIVCVLMLWSPRSTSAEVFEPARHYLWGIESKTLSVPNGSIITEAVLTIHDAANWTEGETLYVHLLDDVEAGMTVREENRPGDAFAAEGAALPAVFSNGDLVYRLSELDDPDSWVWRVFKSPFVYTLADASQVRYTSTLLELIDYAGNDNGFGFSFQTAGQSLQYSRISLRITMKSFRGAVTSKTQTIAAAVAPTPEQGTVALWTFDTTGAETIDHSGSGNDGYLNDGAQVKDGTLLLDGAGECFEAPDSPTLNFDRGLTVAAWIYMDEYSANYPKVVIKPAQEADVNPWELFALDLSRDGAIPRFILSEGQAGTNNGVASSGGELALGQWHHLAGTYDGRTIRLYVNGQLTASKQAAIAIGAAVTPVCVGSRMGEHGFAGRVDDVLLANHALSAADVAELCEAQGLVGEWAFDASRGVIVTDSSGSANHAVMPAPPTSRPTRVVGVQGTGALNFDGDDMLRIKDPGRLDFAPGSFTVAAWIKPSRVLGQFGTWQTILEYDRAGANWFGLWVSWQARFHFRVGYDTLESTTMLSPDQWYFVVGAYDALSGEMTVYINGRADSTALHRAGFTAPAVSSLTIGAYGYEGMREDAYDQYFEGAIDAVRIYNYRLSAGEILDMYIQRN